MESGFFTGPYIVKLRRARLRRLQILGSTGTTPDFAPENTAKTKDPSGGTAGRVKLYRRLGWMGARAEYSLDGEALPLPPMLVAGGSRNVQTARDFFNFFGRYF